MVSSFNSVKRKINPSIIIEDGALLIEAKNDGIFKFDSSSKSGKMRIQESKVIVEGQNGESVPYDIENINTVGFESMVLVSKEVILKLAQGNSLTQNYNLFPNESSILPEATHRSGCHQDR